MKKESISSSTKNEPLEKIIDCINDNNQISTKFLLSLTNYQAKLLMKKMIARYDFKDLINYRHVSKHIEVEDLCKMTSSDYRDGKVLLSDYFNVYMIIFRSIFCKTDGVLYFRRSHKSPTIIKSNDYLHSEWIFAGISSKES
jgi:hypothetical protein